jgi:Ca-activated chloride channel family protein
MRSLLKTFLVLLMLWPLDRVPAQEGPNKDVGETVAKPRKKDADATTNPDQAPIPSKLSNRNKADLPPGAPAFKVDTSVVNVDVAVLDNRGHFIPNIPRGNFRILEDNVPQQIANFNMGEAPMTVCLLIEFNARFQAYWSSGWYQTLTASYGFLQTLKPEDYVAVIAYDLRSEILSDFSSDKRKAYEAMQRLRIPGFSESNMFDALADTEDRMSAIEGRKAIVLIATGIDTFSKLTYDKARKALQDAGVPIYAIGIREMVGIYGGLPREGITTLQAENMLKTFSKETGGMAFFPRFFGEFPSIYGAISQSLRNQYSLAYSSTNQAKDGSFRKIKVELVNPATNEPLRVTDEKGKPVKYSIVAKAGYKAPREVE